MIIMIRGHQKAYTLSRGMSVKMCVVEFVYIVNAEQKLNLLNINNDKRFLKLA